MSKITILEALQLSLNATKKYVDDAIGNIEINGGSNINDTTPSATTTYSSNKIERIKEDLSSQISAIGGSGGSSGGMTSEQTQQLNAAYEHSQSTHAPSNAEANVQVDWNETNTTSDSYIKNKPTNLATTDDIPTVPTKTSQLTNDSDFATNSSVDQKIADAQLSGGEVDLSGYVTKEIGNANQITFADGQTFQAKLDAGTLKGEKGDQGLKGDKGDTGERGEQGIQGEKGDPGINGAKGDKGDAFTYEDFTPEQLLALKGEKGDKGDPGEQGPQGVSGADSIDDATASASTTYSSNKIESIKEDFNSQINAIANNFTTEQNDSSFIIKYGNKVIAEIPLNITPTVYGNIIVDATNLEITEGGTSTFTVCLDQAPTKNQVINIVSSNSKVAVSPSELTFTPSNYNTTQTVTVCAEDDVIEDNGYTLTLTLSSDNVDNVVINVTVKDNDLIISWHTLTSEEMTNGTLIGVPVVKGFNTSYENVELPNTQAYNLETEQTTQSTIKRLKFADGIKFRRSSSLGEGSKVQTLFPNLQYLHIGNYFDYNGNTLNYYPPMTIEGMTTLEKVEGTIPSTVTNLNRAFAKCTNLTKVPSIPSGITTWNFAFDNCVNLHNVTVESDILSLNTSLPAFSSVPSCIIRCNDNSVIHNEIVERCGKPQINSLGKAEIVYFESLNGVSPKNINCFGDSLTHGINNITPYPKYLQDMLNTSEYLVYNVSQVRYTSQQIKESYMDICYPCVKDIAVIWSGSNDENKTATKEQLVNNVQSLVNSLPSGTEYIVVGLITYQWSQEVDDSFEAAFGDKFLNMHDYLCNNKAFSDIGEAPTSEDITAINSNNMPPSLIQNNHQTELGAKATAYAIKEKLLSLGYIS